MYEWNDGFNGDSGRRISETSLGFRGMEYRYPGLTNVTVADTLPSMAKAEVIEYTDDFGGCGSTSIEHVWYHQDTGRMTVRFRQGGLYSYDDVTVQDYFNFMNADSLGTHFRAVFRRPGNPWPGAKHNDRTTEFKLVDAKGQEEEPDVPGVEFTITINVQGGDWHRAVETLKKHMADAGFQVGDTSVRITV